MEQNRMTELKKEVTELKSEVINLSRILNEQSEVNVLRNPIKAIQQTENTYQLFLLSMMFFVLALATLSLMKFFQLHPSISIEYKTMVIIALTPFTLFFLSLDGYALFRIFTKNKNIVSTE